jgi:hypothetical protein
MSKVKSTTALNNAKAIKEHSDAAAKVAAASKGNTGEKLVKSDPPAVIAARAAVAKVAKKAKAFGTKTGNTAKGIVGELTIAFVTLDKAYSKAKLWNPQPTMKTIYNMICELADYQLGRDDKLDYLEDVIRRAARQCVIMRSKAKSKSIKLNAAGNLEGPDRVITPVIYNKRTKKKRKNLDADVRDMSPREITSMFELVAPGEVTKRGTKLQAAQSKIADAVMLDNSAAMKHLSQMMGSTIEQNKSWFNDLAPSDQELAKRLFQKMIKANVDIICQDDYAARIKARKSEQAVSEIRVAAIRESHEAGNRQAAS